MTGLPMRFIGLQIMFHGITMAVKSENKKEIVKTLRLSFFKKGNST
jgi:hypothetical protein